MNRKITDFALAGYGVGLGASGFASAGMAARVSRCNKAPSAMEPSPTAQSWKKCRRVRCKRNEAFPSGMVVSMQKGLFFLVYDLEQAVGLQDFQAFLNFRREATQDDAAMLGVNRGAQLHH